MPNVHEDGGVHVDEGPLHYQDQTKSMVTQNSSVSPNNGNKGWNQ
jgi:hypothetical protein